MSTPKVVSLECSRDAAAQILLILAIYLCSWYDVKDYERYFVVLLAPNAMVCMDPADSDIVVPGVA